MSRTFVAGFGGTLIVGLLVGTYFAGSYIRNQYLQPQKITIDFSLGKQSWSAEVPLDHIDH